MRTYADPPATFVRGQGTVHYADGGEYLDFITGLAVVSLGHVHRGGRGGGRAGARSATYRTSTATRWRPKWPVPSTG